MLNQLKQKVRDAEYSVRVSLKTLKQRQTKLRQAHLELLNFQYGIILNETVVMHNEQLYLVIDFLGWDNNKPILLTRQKYKYHGNLSHQRTIISSDWRIFAHYREMKTGVD